MGYVTSFLMVLLYVISKLKKETSSPTLRPRFQNQREAERQRQWSGQRNGNANRFLNQWPRQRVLEEFSVVLGEIIPSVIRMTYGT